MTRMYFAADGPCARARLLALRFRAFQGGHRGGGVQEKLGLRGPKPRVYFTRASRTAAQAARCVNPLDPKYRMQVEMWKRLPLWLANRVGPMISRGLG
jgi:hypothetical protein